MPARHPLQNRMGQTRQRPTRRIRQTVQAHYRCHDAQTYPCRFRCPEIKTTVQSMPSFRLT